jgi:hypothetical protein
LEQKLTPLQRLNEKNSCEQVKQRPYQAKNPAPLRGQRSSVSPSTTIEKLRAEQSATAAP